MASPEPEEASFVVGGRGGITTPAFLVNRGKGRGGGGEFPRSRASKTKVEATIPLMESTLLSISVGGKVHYAKRHRCSGERHDTLQLLDSIQSLRLGALGELTP